MFNLNLPDFEVILHLRYNDFGKKLENEILRETALLLLDESTEYHGAKDFHWSFRSWLEAVSAGEILKKFCNNPNVLLLKIKANHQSEIEPIVLKG
jgi:hypothetical protein